MGHLIRLLPRTTRTRNLLLALSISLIGAVSLSAQQPRSSPSAAPTAQPVTPTPSASPSVVPSATASSPTPIGTATTAVTPSIPANTPTAAPTPNTTQSSNWRGIFKWGDFMFEGPIWFVLIGLIAVLVVTVVLPARVVSQVKDKWSFSAKTWIIILLIGIGVFFILGLLLGVRRSQPTSSGTSQPLAQLPDLRPTPSPSPGDDAPRRARELLLPAVGVLARRPVGPSRR